MRSKKFDCPHPFPLPSDREKVAFRVRRCVKRSLGHHTSLGDSLVGRSLGAAPNQPPVPLAIAGTLAAGCSPRLNVCFWKASIIAP